MKAKLLPHIMPFLKIKQNYFTVLLLFFIQQAVFSQTTNISGIINTYYAAVSINYCSNSITVSNSTGLNLGEKVLIIQMKGADIDLTNTPASGSVTNINDAGNYEFAIVDSMAGNELVFSDSLINTYDPVTGFVQIIPVPQYNNVNVIAELTCLKWDGTIGGVLVFEAAGTVTLNANVNLNGKGFRGGDLFQCSANYLGTLPNYVMPTMNRVKGEGFASIPWELAGGRGTIANGGGAGGAQPQTAGLTDAWYNGGGGGGNCGLGGEGGKSSTFNSTQYPGGVGGRKFNYALGLNKIFMGGGGGSGHRRHSTSGPTNGTDGGGIAIIVANTLVGNSMLIQSNGIDNAGIINNVGRGGGGAGGAIVLSVPNYSGNLTVSVKGGLGGSNSGGNYVGPGGGGGGGAVLFSTPTVPAGVTTILDGGSNGFQMSYSPPTGHPWGATPGESGCVATNLVIAEGVNEFIFIDSVTSASTISPICQGDTIFLIGGTVPGNAQYLWTGPSGFNSNVQSPFIPNATPANSGTYHLQVLINGCPGPPVSANVTVYPTPSIPTVLDTAICFGNTTPTLVDTSNAPGIVNWYNNPSLSTSLQTGNSYTPTVAAVGTYTYFITHTQNGCVSPPDTAVLTINAIPNPPTASNQSVCQGGTIPALTATGTGVIQWYSNAALTTLAHTGSSFATPHVTAGAYTYYVTQTENGCRSLSTTVTLTINTLPSVNAISNITVCPGETISIPAFASTPAGASFTWANSNTAIGLGSSDSGNINSWTAPSNVGANIVGTISVTPSLNGCPGSPLSFTVTIKPTPSANTISNVFVCPGSLVSIGNFVSVPAGASFAWTNSNTAIGLAASGSNNIPSFSAGSNSSGSNITGNIAVIPTLNSCSGSAMNFSINVYPSPTVTQKPDIAVCPGATINIGAFVSAPTGASFSWNNSNTLIGLGASGAGSISNWIAPSNSTGNPITGTISVSASLNGCTGPLMEFDVTIYPTPSVNPVSNIAQCPGTTITIPPFTSSPAGAGFNWTNSNTAIGIGSAGSGSIPPWIAPANTGSNIQGSITVVPVLNGCTGTSTGFTVTIYPTPVANAVSNIEVCPGATVTIPTFGSVPAGASFAWSNSNTAIGLGAGGTSNITSWVAPANATGLPIIGDISVIPTLNGCSGSPMNFSVTIKPTPVADQITNITVCPGSTITIPPFTSVPTGATYAWTNSNPLIGIGGAGSGSIPQWIAPANPSGVPINGGISVIPTLNGCAGVGMNFSVTIYPTPSLSPVADIAVCPGSTITIPDFVSIPAGGVFDWLNSNTAIGLGGSGSGNIASWVAPPNTSGADITGVITVTPTVNGCPGTPFDFSVTVYPTPDADQLPDIIVCPGDVIVVPAFTSLPTGASYTWNNSNTAIGLGASGTGIIAQWIAPSNATGNIISGDITVIPSLNGCIGLPMTFNVSINPTPSVGSINDIVVCPGDPVNVPSFTSAPSGANFAWTNSNAQIGLGISGNGDISQWSAPPNTTGSDFIGTITVTGTLDACSSQPETFTVTVFTAPTVNQIADITVCPGDMIDVGTFISNPTGSTFSWINNNTAIGLPASGNAQITPWAAATNTTGAPLISTITVTPSSSFSCVGIPMSFTITVNPTPEVTQLADIEVCPGSTITVPAFTSTPLGATYAWTNSATSIGLGAAGSGLITSWIAPINSTGNPFIGTISVVPTINSCVGPAMDFSVTVLPTPELDAITDFYECPGALINIPAFSSNPSGATVTWINSETLVGLPASGTGDISPWNAPANNTGTPFSATITATPELNGCPGQPINFEIVVYPTPEMAPVSNIEVCPGDQINIPAFVTLPTGAIFEWTNDNTLIGLGASSTGLIPAWTAPANTSGNNIVANIEVIPSLSGCYGDPVTFSITIKPTPETTQLSDIGVCPGDLITIPQFTSNPGGTSFDWTNSNTAIGILAAGIGDINAWNAPSNTTGSDITGDISVISTLNGCPSLPMTFEVTIYTAPTVNPIANVEVCPGTTINIGSFVSNPTGSTFDWANTNIDIGIPVSGTGNILPWTAPANITGNVITGTVTVTPSSTFSCIGVPMSFDVAILPTPIPDAITDFEVCPGELINTPDFVSVPTGAAFTWVNTNAAIGLGSSGSGNITPWVAPANTTGAAFVGIITGSPELNGCIGPDVVFSVTVHPTPAAPAANDEEVCFGFTVPDLVAAGPGTMQWYDDAALSNPPVFTGSAFATGHVSVGTYTYYVTQTENNCESLPTEVSLTIHPIPAAPVSSNVDVCYGVTVPDFTATGTGTIEWYSDINLSTLVFTGNPFATVEINVGTYDYYVIQTENACQSPYTQVTLTIQPIPASPASQDENVCEGYTVPDLTATGTGLIQWYDDALTQNLVATGATFTPPPTIPGQYVYYVTQTENNCASLPTQVTLTIFPTPPAPVAANQAACEGLTIPDLSATGTGTIQWYDDAQLIQPPLFTGTPFATGEIAVGTYTYYVTQTENGCESPADTVTLNIYPIPSAPLANDENVCEGQTVPDLVANGTGIIQWYDNPGLGMPVQTGSSYNTYQVLAGIYDYYVTQTENGCESAPTHVVLTIYPVPAPPLVSNVEVCYNDPVPDLSATGTGIIQWYDNPGAIGPALYTGTDYTTNMVAVDSYNYYVTQTENGCESAPALVTLTIHGIPLAPLSSDVVVCFGDTNVPHFTTTATGTINWYDDTQLNTLLHTGSSYASGEINVGVYDYFLTQTVNNCESPSSQVNLTINPIPVPPTSSDESSCFGQPVPDLTATGTGLIQWYSDASLTPPPVHIGSPFTTPQNLSGTYTYYVTQFENGCESQATEVTLTIIALPQPPQVTNETICFGQTTPNLTATATGTINWHDDATLNPVLYTGSSYATGQVAVGTYDYYVTQTHLTTGCQSNPAIATLQINPIPTAPTATNFESCTGYPTPNFTATGTGTLNWYSDSPPTVLVYTGNNFASQHTQAGTYTYYVTQTVNNCEGPETAVTLTIHQTPAAPVASNETACFGQTIPNLTATGTGTINWYTDAALNSLVFTGASFATPHVAVGTYTYYVTQTENNCESPSDTVTLTIYPIPVVPVVNNAQACFGQTIHNLTTTAAGTVQWYNSLPLTTPVYTGLTYATGQVAVGTYTYYITHVQNGCESAPDTATLTIYPIPSAPVATDKEVCYGLPTPNLDATGTGTLDWYSDALLTNHVGAGAIYSTGLSAVGSYTYYVTQTENACASLATAVNLTIKALPAAPVSNNEASCFGATVPDLSATAPGTINWYSTPALTTPVFTGNPYATGQINVGTYTYYVTQTNTVTTCQSLPDTVTLTIHPIPLAPVASDTSGCFGSPIPSLTATGTGTINWYNNVNLTPVLFTGATYATGQAAVNSYTYYVTQTVNNCEGPAATVVLTIHPIPAAPVVSATTPVCEGEPINFTADTVANASYAWTGPSGYTSTTQNPVISPSTVANGGQYSLVVTVNGCPGPASTTNVAIIPALTPSISGNAPFCEGHSTDLDAGVFDAYMWSTGDSVQVITVTQAGTYTVTVWDANGCSATDQVTATFTIPPPANAGPDGEICFSDNIQINASGGVIYDWSPSSGLSNAGISNPIASPFVTTTYVLTVLDNMGCVGKDTVVITVHPLPTVNFAVNYQTGCEPLTVDFTDLSTADISSWDWNFGDPISGSSNTSNVQNPVHTYNTAGDYSVSLAVTTIHGCEGQINMNNLITVYPVPTADFTYYPEDIDISNSVVSFVDLSTNANALTWNFGDNSPSSNISNPVHEYVDPGTYQVMLVVQSTLGCTDTMIREVIYKPYYTLYVPSAFSPNGDGNNDVFMPEGVGLNNEEFNFYIYNRWGELVFETNDYHKGWDGKTFQGNDAPENVYTWIILMQTLDGSDFVYRHTGHVFLLRTK